MAWFHFTVLWITVCGLALWGSGALAPLPCRARCPQHTFSFPVPISGHNFPIWGCSDAPPHGPHHPMAPSLSHLAKARCTCCHPCAEPREAGLHFWGGALVQAFSPSPLLLVGLAFAHVVLTRNDPIQALEQNNTTLLAKGKEHTVIPLARIMSW